MIGGLAIIAFFVVRQRRSERFEQRSLFIPAALAVYGLVLLHHTTRRDPFTASSGLLLSLSAVASICFGIFRGRTIELFVREGELWERATWANSVLVVNPVYCNNIYTLSLYICRIRPRSLRLPPPVAWEPRRTD